jgi:hypothetical protein
MTVARYLLIDLSLLTVVVLAIIGFAGRDNRRK